MGNQLTSDKVKNIETLKPIPYEPPVIEEQTEETEQDNSQNEGSNDDVSRAPYFKGATKQDEKALETLDSRAFLSTESLMTSSLSDISLKAIQIISIAATPTQIHNQYFLE